MIVGLKAFGAWLKGVPEWLWIVLLAALGVFVVRQDARKDGRRQGRTEERERQAEVVAAKDHQIRETSEHVEDVADRVRDPSEYNDSRMRDESAEPLPRYHYRD